MDVESSSEGVRIRTEFSVVGGLLFCFLLITGYVSLFWLFFDPNFMRVVLSCFIVLTVFVVVKPEVIISDKKIRVELGSFVVEGGYSEVIYWQDTVRSLRVFGMDVWTLLKLSWMFPFITVGYKSIYLSQHFFPIDKAFAHYSERRAS